MNYPHSPPKCLVNLRPSVGRLLQKRGQLCGLASFKFDVSENLRSALRRLRLPDRDRSLWVDAICINQNNTAERSEQVSLMSQIYGNAGAVCVWAGESGEESELALNFIKERVLKLERFNKLLRDESTAESWKALANLMMRPWFSRRYCTGHPLGLGGFFTNLY